MKKLIVILFLSRCIPLFSQTTDRIDSLLNDLIYSDFDTLLVQEKSQKFDFIYAGTSFNNKTFYAGREISKNMYNISGHLYYYSSTSLFAGASAIWFDQLTSVYSSTKLSIGYFKTIDKKKLVSFRTSYSYILYNSADSIKNYLFHNNFNLGFSFLKDNFGARINSNLLVNDESIFFISSGVNYYVTIIKLNKYNKIYTSPDVSFFLGSEKVETSTYNSQNSQTGSSTDLKNVFSLLNTQLYIPLGISIGNFNFECGYSINFPTTRDAYISYPVNSFFSFFVGYLLPLAKK